MRRQELIKILESSVNGMPLTVEKIAELLNVSERKVRYDLDAIGDALQKRGYVLHRKTQKGIWLSRAEGSEEKTEKNEYSEYVPSRQERVQAVAVYALAAAAPVTADFLAERLSVSRTTLLADLKSAEAYLGGYRLRLQAQKGRGYWIDGEEKQIRRLLIDIFSQCLYDFGRGTIRREKFSYAAELFCFYSRELPAREVADALIALAGRRRLNCHDGAINYMIVAALVQLRRLRDGHAEPAEAGAPLDVKDRTLMLLAEELIAALSPHHAGVGERGETRFLLRQLLRSKISLTEASEAASDEADDQMKLAALGIARTFIEDCQLWLGDVYLDDEELMYNLALHLQPAVRRARFGIELSNPLLPQIQQKYENLYQIAQRAAQNIEKKLQLKISDDEIGYLAIHLGAAIERKKLRRSRQLQAVLVCGNGLGTANLLSMTLKNHLQCLHIQRVVSVYELQNDALTGIDLVISTIPLELEHTAVLHISPILSATEIKVIESQIQYLFHRKFAVAAEGAAPRRAAAVGLLDVLDASGIALDVRAASWEEAVRAAGDLLVGQGAAEPRYVEGMLACIRRMGPYIVIGPRLAMPHARPEDGVRRICLSMVRLAEPVPFGSAPHDPIDLVFAFGAVDNHSHLGVLGELWQIFQDEAMLRRLRGCADSAAVLREIAAFQAERGKYEGERQG